MRTRERGIGNMTFIAVLVLLVIAIAMFFVARSDADKYQASWKAERAKAEKAADIQQAAGEAYDAWLEIAGLGINELRRSGEGEQTYPTAAKIKGDVANWLMTQAGEIAQKSQAKIKARQYQIDKTNNVVKVQETGDTATITLYGTPLVKETITFQGFVATLGEQFRYAAKAIEDNNKLFEDEYKNAQTRTAALQQRVTEQGTQYQNDVASKAQLYDGEKTRADQMQDQVNQSTAKNDQLSSEISALKTNIEKETRTKDRTIQALNDRIRAEKAKMEIALKEDPKDGEVLVADAKQGLVFLNRGKNFRVFPDMKVRIWRVGKGNVREDIAEVEVIDVGETSSTARVVKWLAKNVPVAEGMSFSSPFYDPFKKLRVHIAGNLKYYPSDLAKRRLAESGCVVAERLDDTVDVVVLGEPAVDIGGDAESPEEAAANEEKAKAQRAARVRDVMDTAATLGAVVVTEEVLQTFIEY